MSTLPSDTGEMAMSTNGIQEVGGSTPLSSTILKKIS
jgi:hypothetical protein